MAHRAEAAALLDSQAHVERRRMFFLACAQLFGDRGGREWDVAHDRFERRLPQTAASDQDG